MFHYFVIFELSVLDLLDFFSNISFILKIFEIKHCVIKIAYIILKDIQYNYIIIILLEIQLSIY